MNSPQTQRKLTPNQQQRRARILSTARQLVAEHGYDGTIMRDVASLAGVSPTTLYNLYNTKDELLLEALRESVAESWVQAEETTELGLDRLLTQLSHSVADTRQGTAYAKAITQALLRANHNDPMVDVLIRRNARATRSSLAAMRAAKQIALHVDLDKLSLSMVSGFWSNYMLWSKDILDLDELETHLLRTFLSLLLPATHGRMTSQVKQLLGELL
jgi:AcrR family transcriptional regulator